MAKTLANRKNTIKKTFLSEAYLPVVYEPNLSEVNNDDLISWFEKNQKEWRRDLETYGAILLRGFPLETANDFQTLLFATKEKLGEFYLGTSPRDQVVKHVFTASELPPHYPIMQHAEMSFLDNPPKLLFFFAETVSSFGGETPLTDLRQIYKELNPNIISKIKKFGIRYRRKYDGPSNTARFSMWKTKRWDEMFGTTDLIEVNKISKKNRFDLEWFGKDSLIINNHQSGFRNHLKTGVTAWHNHVQTFHVDSAVFEVWNIFKKQKTLRSLGVALLLTALTFIKKFSGSKNFDVHVTYGNGDEFTKNEIKEISDLFWKHMIANPWQKGDLLIIDNYSVSHGRLPFSGDRRILVSWSE
ncbi:TauD/TfdA family dioxygenase [Leptospira sp. 96542]|nr:TauD/TfdA family dioxygenase [Leptospira sp. 96542]